jgi:hypothetical protein
MEWYQKPEVVEARAELKKLLKPGETVYTILRHRSASGMYRVIDVFIFRKNEPSRLSWSVALATGHRYDKKHEGVGVKGCGMDCGFEIVYNLGRSLYKTVPKRAQGGNSVDGNKDGGYTFRHRWM